MTARHSYSPLSPTQTHKLASFASSNRRPLTTLSVLLVLPLLAFLASYPVHQGHPIDSLSSWSESIRPPPGLPEDRLLDVVGGDEQRGRVAKSPCDKTLLYTFSGPWGFASEFMIFLRAALFAKEEGYAILLDSDVEWTYVNIAQYLLPNKLECVPRPEWRTRERTPVGEAGWERAHHLRTSRNDGMWHIESHMRNKFKRPALEGEVEDDDPSHHHHEPSVFLPADMTLMPGYKSLFLQLSAVVKDMWRPNEIISLQVDELVAQHRLKERLSVGVHIRMGDKAGEQAADILREGGDSEFRQGDLKAYLAAAQEMLPLLQASAGGREFTLKPLLLVMSDSPHVSAQMQSGVLVHHDYEIAQLPDPPNQPEEGHDQGHFNSMGWRERIETGEGLVRDLTIVGQVTNGFIGTASSNVGRLLALLCGPEKVLHQQLTRSLDTPFYWTIDFEKWT